MNRTALVVAVLVIVGTLSAFPVSGMAPAANGNDDPRVTNDRVAQANNNSTIAPGERLSGVVGVQEAEIEGEIQVGALDIAFDRADDNASKAEVIARQSINASERLQELEDRKDELQEARENGSMSEGEYRARVAKLAAETQTVERIANRSSALAEGLPEDVLAANGVNVTAIRTLATNADNLTGPEVSAIAQSIAGNERGEVDRRAGRGDGADAPANASEAIDRAEKQIQAARDRIERAEQRVNDTNASENATDALERARDQLANAEEALAMARNASDDGDEDRAMELAMEANEHAKQALESANQAIQAAEDRQGGGQDGQSTGTRTAADGGDGGDQATATPTPSGDDGGDDGDGSGDSPY